MGLSLGHLIIILIIILVLFGAGKLPQMMSDMGKGMKAFKDGMKDEENEAKDLKMEVIEEVSHLNNKDSASILSQTKTTKKKPSNDTKKTSPAKKSSTTQKSVTKKTQNDSAKKTDTKTTKSKNTKSAASNKKKA